MAYETMKEQAGNRLIIRHKDEGRGVTCTSHYADISEFFTLHNADKIEWYQINNGLKIYLVTCPLCGRKHTDGTSGNCI